MLECLPAWLADHSEHHPHNGVRMLSPGQFRRAQSTGRTVSGFPGATTLSLLRRIINWTTIDKISRFQKHPTARFAALLLAVGVAILVVGGAACGSSGAMSCERNADCAHSKDGKGPLECSWPDVYCLDGTCHVECGKACEPGRSDVNPCEAPRLCTSHVSPAQVACTLMPIACTSASNCPLYLPPTPDGGTAAWTCASGTCEYPGWAYATH